MTAPTRIAADNGAEMAAPATTPKGSWLARLSGRTGLSPEHCSQAPCCRSSRSRDRRHDLGGPDAERSTIFLASRHRPCRGTLVYGGRRLRRRARPRSAVAGHRPALRRSTVVVHAGSRYSGRSRIAHPTRELFASTRPSAARRWRHWRVHRAVCRGRQIPKEIIARLVAAMIIVVARSCSPRSASGPRTVRAENDIARAARWWHRPRCRFRLRHRRCRLGSRRHDHAHPVAHRSTPSNRLLSSRARVHGQRRRSLAT